MKLAAITLWILAGAALTGGAYWTFLITPESTVGSLAVSALLLAVAFFLLAVTVNGAIQGWARGLSVSVLRSAITGAAAIVPAVLVFAAVWWLVGSVTDRVTIYSGQINAWFIARFGWSDVSGLFRAIDWAALWMKGVAAPMLALSLMAAITLAGWPSLARAAWLKHAVSPLRLALATLWFALFVVAPWVYLAPWRPQGLPATSVELAFIIAKLSVTALLMATGAALIIRQATSTTSTPSSTI